MIQLITYRDENRQHRVSHGIDTETGKVVILPQELVRTFPTVMDINYGLVLADSIRE